MCFLEVDNDGTGPVQVVEYRPGTLRVSIPSSHRHRSCSSNGSSSSSSSSSSSCSTGSSSSSSTSRHSHHRRDSSCHHHSHDTSPSCRPHSSCHVYTRSDSPESYTTVRRMRVRTRSESFVPIARRMWVSDRRCSPLSPSYRYVEYVEPGAGRWRSRLHYMGRVWEGD